MSNVSLHFEDTEQGGIAFRADYQSGFDPRSPAHTLANQVIKFLDDQAVKKENIVVDIAPTDALQNGKGIDADSAENTDAIRRMASAGKPLIICGNGGL